MCKTMRENREESLVAHGARGGRKKVHNDVNRDFTNWFDKVPGLSNENQLVAWMHRSEAPFISAVASEGDADGSEVRVEMIPRRVWREDPHFVDNYPKGFREWLQLLQRLTVPSFCMDTEYVTRVMMLVGHDNSQQTDIGAYHFDALIIRGAEIVEALTAATRVEDLADAFVWIESAYTSNTAPALLQDIRSRAELLHGSTMLADNVPVPTRAINNEVAFMLMRTMTLEFDICLTGLCGAAHLNGREGVVRGDDPINNERWTVRQNDGTCVSVRALNFVHIRRGEYRRRSP